MNLNQASIDFVHAGSAMFGEGSILNREQIGQIITANPNFKYPFWFVSREEYRAGRGEYKLPILDQLNTSNAGPTVVYETPPNMTQEVIVPVSPPSVDAAKTNLEPVQYLRMAKLLDESSPEVPAKFEGYVPFGYFKDMRQVIASGEFFPIMVMGLSGNGKTLMVEQACALTNRKLVKVNVSVETDQYDLLGGPSLVNGNTVNRDGPVILAMKHGSVLLLDEIDRGSNKLLCLQSILEGKPFFNKNTGEIVHPKPGFNIVATANTKGKGSEDGRYLAQILDDAFLERFPNTYEQEFPNLKTELKIINNEFAKKNKMDDDFAEKLVNWGSMIRTTFFAGGINELISTRRLVDVVRSYLIYGDKKKAIQFCINRFDEEIKTQFFDFYKKIDDSLVATDPVAASEDESVANIWAQEANSNPF